MSLELHGELVEGNIIKGQAVVAWCGGTPGKCITRWVMFAAFPFCYMQLPLNLCIPVSCKTYDLRGMVTLSLNQLVEEKVEWEPCGD